MDFYLKQLTDGQLDTLTGASHEAYRDKQIEAIAYKVWSKNLPIQELIKMV